MPHLLTWLPNLFRPRAPAAVSATNGVAISGSVHNSPITVQTDNTEVLAILKELRARLPEPAAPGAEKGLDEAVANIAKGAAAGDDQLATALNLLRENKIAEATVLLRSVAEDRAARIQKHRKETATAYRNLGAIARFGDPKQALAAYEKAVEFDPEDRESILAVGWLQMDRGMLDGAEDSFRQLRRLTENEPDDWARRWATLGLGEILLRRGNLPAALKAYEEPFATMHRLTRQDTRNYQWQRGLSVSHNRIGDVQVRQDNVTAALENYQAALAIRARLATMDPRNTEWQQDLAISHILIGDMRRRQRDSEGAHDHYLTALTVSERLVATDPDNAAWQDRLAIARVRIGDMQTDPASALSHYHVAHTARKRLVDGDPNNAGLQRNLSVSHERIGDLQLKQGDSAAALNSFGAVLTIRERLVEMDPTNVDSQRGLALSLGRVAMIEAQNGERSKALDRFLRGRGIIAQLIHRSPHTTALREDLANFDSHIAALR